MPDFQLKLPPIDLLPKNPRPLLLKAENTRQAPVVTVTTKKPANYGHKDALEKVAVAEMKRYQEVIGKTVAAQTAKWDEMDKPAREKDAVTLTHAVNQACRSLEGAIASVVKARIVKDARGDQNLLEAQVKAVAQGAIKLTSIGVNVARLVVTAGVDLHAWKSLAGDLKGLVDLVSEQVKSEQKARTELLAAIGKMTTTKQQRLIAAAKAKDWKDKLLLFAQSHLQSEKSLGEKAEAARKVYRNKVASLRADIGKIGARRDALLNQLKTAGKVDEKSIKAGKLMMDISRQVHAMNATALKCQEFADDMAQLLEAAGVVVDDRTVIEKLKKMDKSVIGQLEAGGQQVKDVYTRASAIKSSDVYSFQTAIGQLQAATGKVLSVF